MSIGLGTDMLVKTGEHAGWLHLLVGIASEASCSYPLTCCYHVAVE